MISFVLMFSVVICTIFSFRVNALEVNGKNIYTYTENLIELTVIGDHLSYNDFLKVRNNFFETVRNSSENQGENSSKNILCTIFGHKTTTSYADLTTHHYYDQYPYCKCDRYKVEVCSRCDYSSETLLFSERIGCCVD